MRRVKMQLKWTEIFIFVCLFHACCPAQKTQILKEKKEDTLHCSLKMDQSITVIWFRTTEKNGVQFILSCKNEKVLKKNESLSTALEALGCYSLKIKSFNKETDSGRYNCARYNSNALEFGDTTVLAGEPDPTQAPKVTQKATTTPCATAAPSTPCVCPNKRGVKRDPEKSCELMIWAPLAGGCGLLLVLLIAVSLYCNKIRTRRCPHHYKRQPRTVGGVLHPGKGRLV
ncbi:T-cell surface glycoprotein CD8 alpha chain [Sardina pilchardus]|uniref:T-cell surface glycoprotein CD8 alpha chain n=1 Tax=Sardina pilchardus TaxID=27697 RepID=UPI002E10F83A